MPASQPHRRHIATLALASAFATTPAGAEDLPAGAEEGIRHFVEIHDADKDGKVSMQEMFVAALSRTPDPEKADKQGIGMAIHWEFARVDADRDGAITPDEIKADISAAAAHKKSIAPEDAKLFEGRFSQCSYNALSSVLIHFHGATPKFDAREELEKAAFTHPLNVAKYGGYHGWAPWTSYMVNSDVIEWNGTVSNLRAENFSLRPEETPAADTAKRHITVKYAPGELAALEEKLLAQLRRGPVVMWTPYASIMSPVPQRWNHVEHVDADTDVVPYGPFTHAVTLLLKEDGRIAVFDGSTPDGVFYTDARTAVATSSAMTSFIRIRPPGEGAKTILERSAGIEDEGYNVVVFQKEGEKP